MLDPRELSSNVESSELGRRQDPIEMGLEAGSINLAFPLRLDAGLELDPDSEHISLGS